MARPWRHFSLCAGSASAALPYMRRVCKRLGLECRQAETEAELQLAFNSQLPELDPRHVDCCLSTNSDLCVQFGVVVVLPERGAALWMGSCFVFSEDHLGHSVGRLGKGCDKLLTQLASAYGHKAVRAYACFMSKDYMSRAGELPPGECSSTSPLAPCPTPCPLPFHLPSIWARRSLTSGSTCCRGALPCSISVARRSLPP